MSALPHPWDPLVNNTVVDISMRSTFKAEAETEADFPQFPRLWSYRLCRHLDLGVSTLQEQLHPLGLHAASSSSWPQRLSPLLHSPLLSFFEIPTGMLQPLFDDLNDSFKDLRVKLASQGMRDSRASMPLLAWKLSQEPCLTLGILRQNTKADSKDLKL